MDKQTFIQKAALLQGKYTVNPAVRFRLEQLNLIAVVGATGVGKTTIIEQSGLPYVVSDVTREPRKHEENGKEYNFRSNYDEIWSELEAGEFVQYVITESPDFYGTKLNSYPQNGPCAMAVLANHIPHFKSLGFKRFTQVYIIPPDYDVWMKRVANERLSDLKARLQEARQSLEIALSDSSYIFLVNDKLAEAVNQFRNISMGTLPDAAAQSHGRQLALKLLTQISV